MSTICNAIIRSASIRLDRDAFLSMWLDLDYGGSCQGFGGYVLGAVPSCKAGDHKNQPNLAAEYIVGCLLCADVENVSDLAGKTVRVLRTEDGLGGDIIGIGHIVKDIWFKPKEAFAALGVSK